MQIVQPSGSHDHRVWRSHGHRPEVIVRWKPSLGFDPKVELLWIRKTTAIDALELLEMLSLKMPKTIIFGMFLQLKIIKKIQYG